MEVWSVDQRKRVVGKIAGDESSTSLAGTLLLYREMLLWWAVY